MKAFLWIMLALTIVGLCWFAPSAARADAIPATSTESIGALDVQAVALVWPFSVFDKKKAPAKPQPVPAKKLPPVVQPTPPVCCPATPPPNACAAADTCDKAKREPLRRIGAAVKEAVDATAKAVGRVVRIRRC